MRGLFNFPLAGNLLFFVFFFTDIRKYFIHNIGPSDHKSVSIDVSSCENIHIFSLAASRRFRNNEVCLERSVCVIAIDLNILFGGLDLNA